MKLISPFKSLIQGGVILNLKISAAGGDNIQLDILPQGKDSATGVALPPKALVGTAQEIDENLEEYLQKYAASVARVADLVAGADAELKTIEDAAAAQARKAIDEKTRKAAAKPAIKPASGAPPARDVTAGLLESNEDEGDDDEPSPSTLTTTGGAGQGAAAAAAPVEGVSPDLFNV